jgi:hypothetical protein
MAHSRAAPPVRAKPARARSIPRGSRGAWVTTPAYNRDPHIFDAEPVPFQERVLGVVPERDMKPRPDADNRKQNMASFTNSSPIQA